MEKRRVSQFPEVISRTFINRLDVRNERKGRIRVYSFSSLDVLKNKHGIYRNKEQNKKIGISEGKEEK